jgi:hypothetical protein
MQVGSTRTRRWILTSLAAVTSSLAFGGSGLAASNVPVISHLSAHPRKLCAKKSSRCQHPGTTIRFTVSTNASIRADIRPRFKNEFGYVEFVRRFHAGANSVRLREPRLTPGRWTLRLQGTNELGSGPISVIDVRVVKHTS